MSSEYDPKPFSDPSLRRKEEPAGAPPPLPAASSVPPVPPDPPISSDPAAEADALPYVEAELFEPGPSTLGASVPSFAALVEPPRAPPVVPGLIPPPPSSSAAVTAMVLGIVSCATFCFCYGVPSIVCGVLAIHYARQAERELDGRRCVMCMYDMTGLGGLTCPECGYTARDERELAIGGGTRASQAKTGRICGIVGVSLSVLMLLLGVVMLVVSVAQGSL